MTLTNRDNPTGVPARGPDSDAVLRCVNCGYDLRGLPLPRACPECGEVSDPAREREQAIAWFLNLRSWLYYGAPRCAAAHLHDPRVSRAACLRLGLVLTLPWLALFVPVLAASALIFDVSCQRWWEASIRPGVAHDTDTVWTAWRPLGNPDEFDRIQEPQSLNPSQTWHLRRSPAGVRLAVPRPDPAIATIIDAYWLAALIVTLGAVLFVGLLLLFAPYPAAERRRTTLALAAGYAPYVLAYPLITLLVLVSGRQPQPLWVMFVFAVVVVSQFAVMVWTIGTTSLLLPRGRPIARLTCISIAGAWFIFQALPPLASLGTLR